MKVSEKLDNVHRLVTGYNGAEASGEPPTMSDTITRPELDAKLELIEARADARMSRFEEKIDQAIGEMRRDRADFRAELSADKADRRAEMRNLKITMVTTAIAAVIGLYAANISLIQTMFGAFESGKTTASAISEASASLKQTQDELKAIRERLDQQAKSQR